jgi:hypothetical protein
VADAKQYLDGVALVYTDDDPKQLAECMKKALAVYDNEETRSYYAAQIENCIKENSVEATAEEFRKFVTGLDTRI